MRWSSGDGRTLEIRKCIISITGYLHRVNRLTFDRDCEHKMSLQAKLQQASIEFQNLQAELSKVVEARQKLDAQLSENELVKKVRL